MAEQARDYPAQLVHKVPVPLREWQGWHRVAAALGQDSAVLPFLHMVITERVARLQAAAAAAPSDARAAAPAARPAAPAQQPQRPAAPQLQQPVKAAKQNAPAAAAVAAAAAAAALAPAAEPDASPPASPVSPPPRLAR